MGFKAHIEDGITMPVPPCATKSLSVFFLYLHLLNKLKKCDFVLIPHSVCRLTVFIKATRSAKMD